jgi:hypothetical protein
MSIKKRRSTNNQEMVKNIYRRVFEDSLMSQQISEDEAGKLIKNRTEFTYLHHILDIL